MESNQSFILKDREIKDMLAILPVKGKNLLEPLAHIAGERALPFKLIELSDHVNKPEIHTYLHDLWYCIEGELRFFCGGAMVEQYTRSRADRTLDETEIRAKSIEGAKESVVTVGDWFFIPAGTPHQHITKGTARLMIIKIPQHRN